MATPPAATLIELCDLANRVLTTVLETRRQSWTPSRSGAAYWPRRQPRWTCLDPRSLLTGGRSRSGRMQQPVPQPRRLSLAKRDQLRPPTSGNDHHRSCWLEFASRGSGVQIPSAPPEFPQVRVLMLGQRPSRSSPDVRFWEQNGSGSWSVIPGSVSDLVCIVDPADKMPAR